MWRPATADDVDAVLRGVPGHRRRRSPELPDHPRGGGGGARLQLRGAGGGHPSRGLRARAVWWPSGSVMEPPRQETLVREFMNGGVHPDVRGRGIGRELLAWQRARGEQKLAASEKRLPGWLVGYADRRAEGRRRLLEAGGFEVARYFQTMERDLADPIPAVSPTGERADRAVPAGAGGCRARSRGTRLSATTGAVSRCRTSSSPGSTSGSVRRRPLLRRPGRRSWWRVSC